MKDYLYLASFLATALAAVVPWSTNTADYEYVVIGSGAGGSAVAVSLAKRGHSVFLLEAGHDLGEELSQQVPALFAQAAGGLDSSWQFFVQHYANDDVQAKRDPNFAYLTTNGSYHLGPNPPPGAEPLGIVYPRGATVGGSTQVNAMNLGPPPDHEWDHIAELTGDDSFRGEAMRKYLIELETCHYLPVGTQGHGFNGPIDISRNNISFIIDSPGKVDHFSQAVRQVEGRLPETADDLAELLQRDPYPAGEYSEGLYMLTTAVTESKRRSGARNWVVDTMNAKSDNNSQRNPLTLSTDSLATRILFDHSEEQPRAYGVEYMVGEALYAADQRYDPKKSGEIRTVEASKEVIIAGGAFNTPQILKLSGVGPRQELEDLAIPVVADVPAVGAFLQDNYEAPVITEAAIPWDNPAENCTFQLDNNDPCFQEWLLRGTGAYGEAASAATIVYKTSASDNEHPDIELIVDPSRYFSGFYPGADNPPMIPGATSYGIIQMPGPGLDSKGSVTLRSSNPRDVPFIDFNFFSGEAGQRDVDAMVEAYDLVTRIFSDTPEPVAPFTYLLPEGGTNDTAQFIRDHAYGHHASSTCRMGPAGDPDTCVDSEFRVQGIKGLRVADASVFPRTPGAWTTTPTFMIGLKLASILSAGH